MFIAPNNPFGSPHIVLVVPIDGNEPVPRFVMALIKTALLCAIGAVAAVLAIPVLALLSALT